MRRQTKSIVFILAILLLALLFKPVRLYFKGFFGTLFAKEIIIYDKVPISNDLVYRIIHVGEFESDQYNIVRTDSFQVGRDKFSEEIWKYKIKWKYENEYFLYDSLGRLISANKINRLTDTSYTRIINSGGVGKKIEFKIITAHNI